MASYVLEGYTTPSGVDSRKKVKEWQEQLGVTVDGIWGPKTQAAYEASAGTGKNDWSKPADIYGSFYNDALSLYSAPTVSVSMPSRAELEADAAAILRPSVNQAIENRRAQSQANMAELDADAASRGMGASTFVSSMKGREMTHAERDVATMESNYSAALADQVASYLQYYTNLSLQAEMQNAQMRFSAQSAAAGLASQWYDAYLAANAASGAASGTSRRSSSKAGTQYYTPTAEEYEEYVRGMSSTERLKLYTSGEDIWEESRQELQGALGASRYAALEAATHPKNTPNKTRATLVVR